MANTQFTEKFHTYACEGDREHAANLRSRAEEIRATLNQDKRRLRK